MGVPGRISKQYESDFIPGGLEGTYLCRYPQLLQTMWNSVDLHDMLQINEDYS